jgi:hypothetical protein
MITVPPEMVEMGSDAVRDPSCQLILSLSGHLSQALVGPKACLQGRGNHPANIEAQKGVGASGRLHIPRRHMKVQNAARDE